MCIGPEAVALAENRIGVAESTFAELHREVDRIEELSLVQDAQTLELPFLIEYLALLQESNSLPKAELQATARFADSLLNGTLNSNNFPIDQLALSGFRGEDLNAMLALTRKFSGENRVSNEDAHHLKRLREFVHARSSNKAISATERLQLLNIPEFSGRTQLFDKLQNVSTDTDELSTDTSGHSGIWLSFWSLRLVEAISEQSYDTDWNTWGRFVRAVADAKSSEIPALRIKTAVTLQERWTKAIEAIEKLQDDRASEVFVSEKDTLELLSKEIARRRKTSVNQTLFASLSRTIEAQGSDELEPSPTLDSPDVELSPDLTCEVHLKTRGVSKLYIRNENFTLRDPKPQNDGQWSHLQLSEAENAGASVTLRLQSKTASPVPVRLIGVDQQGTVVVTKTVTVQPSTETKWRLEVVQVEEGNTTPRSITLPDGNSLSEKLLPLPPSTWDRAQKKDMPVVLRVQLVKVMGVTQKVKVRVRPVDTSKAGFGEMTLSIPNGESPVIVPLAPPATAATDTAAATPAAATSSPFDMSAGVVFEVTPLDLPQPVTSMLTLYPRLHSPESLFETPEPMYDHDTEKLTLRLKRRELDNSTVIWPTQFPAEISLNPALRKQLESGSLTTLDASDFLFTLQFKGSIDTTFGKSHYEFGVSVAGVPHAWWWELGEGPIPQRVKGVR